MTLRHKRGLVVGIANEQSIAWGCARAFCRAGATLVEPLFAQLDAPIRMPLDVGRPDQMAAVFDAITVQWGALDFVLHSVAYAPKADLQGRVVDSSPEGFSLAMDTSCHSFIRMARLAEPLMTRGGSLMAMSYLGAEQVVANYGVMGPVKAALEASVRYLAAELGGAGIRVNAISPGVLPTRAASGLPDFGRLLDDTARRAPLHHALDIDDVGAFCAFLAGDGARAITGGTHYIDAGVHMLG
ncbi:enoyl-ACP reductase FabI [Burkholderia cenocepacia]|uniref:enoyl-ACP reductase FabI n=1 Tax=Burkholderia cenocepacia TaxID=95486 RepID=UPI001B8E7194|nr:enoyl-ACP reductase FabI [Burkholderia cenocepacia]MBR7988719.1 enoyl-ACP reductase FabI [Burkholderia cenocepacia]